jgi:hypothetical protein
MKPRKYRHAGQYHGSSCRSQRNVRRVCTAMLEHGRMRCEGVVGPCNVVSTEEQLNGLGIHYLVSLGFELLHGSSPAGRLLFHVSRSFSMSRMTEKGTV